MRILLLALLVLGLSCSVVGAVNIGLPDVINALEAPFKADAQDRRGTATSSIDDFQAEFFQESQLQSIGRTQRGQGEVSFKFVRRRANEVPLAMFRWEYRQPTVQEIVSDGETMWVYLPENKQVIVSDLAEVTRQQAENPVTFLSGLGNLSRDFSIHWANPGSDREGNYILELRPRRVSQMIQGLQIVVSRDAVVDYVQNGTSGEIFPILATMVTDPQGNRTSIEFRDVRVNRGLSSGFFEFRRPPGVEVVRPSELQSAY